MKTATSISRGTWKMSVFQSGRDLRRYQFKRGPEILTKSMQKESEDYTSIPSSFNTAIQLRHREQTSQYVFIFNALILEILLKLEMTNTLSFPSPYISLSLLHSLYPQKHLNGTLQNHYCLKRSHKESTTVVSKESKRETVST